MSCPTSSQAGSSNYISAGNRTGSINSTMFYALRFPIKNKQTEYILAFPLVFLVSIATRDWAVTQSVPCLSGKATERHLLWCGFSKIHRSRIYGHAGSQACSRSVSLWVHMKITDCWMAYRGCFLPLWSPSDAHMSFSLPVYRKHRHCLIFRWKILLKTLSQTWGQRSDKLSATATNQSQTICRHTSVSLFCYTIWVLMYEVTRCESM